ncbi:MAG TPA: VOC family protein [Aquihabitans sp.]|nr:VOC family protein [Aquihabitans sp.]
MHRSRLAAIAIDCPTGAHDDTVSFWSGALGGEPKAEGEYTAVGHVAGREVFVQRIDGEPRLHLDIETDDVEAEVARLEQLGATRVRPERTWWIMRDPSGQLFCVVRPQTPDFPGDAATWP